MQNYRMIDEVRAGIAPLVEAVSEGLPTDIATRAAGDLLNTAVSIRRGFICSLAAGHMCGVCADLTIERPVCTYMQETGMSIPPAPTFTARELIGDI